MLTMAMVASRSSERERERRRTCRGGNWSSSTARRTSSAILGFTGRLLLSTRDTVAMETPAFSAIRVTDIATPMSPRLLCDMPGKYQHNSSSFSEPALHDVKPFVQGNYLADCLRLRRVIIACAMMYSQENIDAGEKPQHLRGCHEIT